MPEPALAGDADALAMAAPAASGRALGRLIPPGPVLELCCGVGGLTRGLAETHWVVAVDRHPGRLAHLKGNLRGQSLSLGRSLGLADRVSPLCCDLTRPALLAPSGRPFAACVLDPDWSPPGSPPAAWTPDLQSMQPPAASLARWAWGFSARLALRLPPGREPGALTELGAWRVLPMRKLGRESFRFLLLGPWPERPAALEV